MLRMVGFPDPKRALRTYPFELSGGLRQRAMIAMALVCRPALLIADEPTTALDVTIQAQILELMQEMKEKFGMAMGPSGKRSPVAMSFIAGVFAGDGMDVLDQFQDLFRGRAVRLNDFNARLLAQEGDSLG